MTKVHRILLIVDVYPPARVGGATVYTVNLAEQLVKMGLHVEVLCAGSWEEGDAHFNGITQDERNGVKVYRLHLNWRKALTPFDCLYDNVTLAPVFRDFLTEHQPDVVHINSCLTLSARVIEEAQRQGIPTVLHLHEFWFLCALQNLVRKDGAICYGPESPWGCQECVLAGTKALRWTNRVLPASWQRALFTAAGRAPRLTRLPGLIGMLGNMERRQTYLRQILEAIDVVIAPARYSLELFARHGFNTERFDYSVLGFDTSWAAQVKHTQSPSMRFGYIGNLQRIKGVHVLVEAFNALPLHAAAELFIYGDPTQDRVYVEGLQAHPNPKIHWMGAFAREQLPEVMSALDVIVVPSICHEVNPTVIKEAFAAKLPVIASDQGSTNEMIVEGVSGYSFQSGDSNHLREKMLFLIENAQSLTQLRQGIPAIKTIYEEGCEMQRIYESLYQKHGHPVVKE